MNYKCECCDYSTKEKFNYEKHLNTNKHKTNIRLIKEKSPKIVTEETTECNKRFECKFCNYAFTNAGNLSRHKKTCSEKPLFIDKIKELEEVNRMLKEKNELLQNENAYLKTKVNTTEIIVKTHIPN